MTALKSITVIGGGLAGLTLGIGLRRRGVPVAVWEAGGYPRHRVCGEFICGDGVSVLQRLELLDSCRRAGAVPAHTVMFARGPWRAPVRRLTLPALCFSRYALDSVLAENFQQSGGELRVGSRWSGDSQSEGLVYASGRRLPSPGQANRWFGVKAHAVAECKVKLEADLEMHLSAEGYVGVNRLGDGTVNVCGLFRAREDGRHLSKEEWLRGQPDSLLRKRLDGAKFDAQSFCSVAGLALHPRRAAEQSECRVGDALTMTPPVTGNGMSMAFESAEIAVDPLVAYSRGEMDWARARQQIGERCDHAFAHRLAWARRLQAMLLSPILQGQLGRALMRSEWLWQFLFKATR